MNFQDITASFEQPQNRPATTNLDNVGSLNHSKTCLSQAFWTFVGYSRITQVLLATLQAATSVLMNPVSWNL